LRSFFSTFLHYENATAYAADSVWRILRVHVCISDYRVFVSDGSAL